MAKTVNQIRLQCHERVGTLLDGKEPLDPGIVQAERQASATGENVNAVHEKALCPNVPGWNASRPCSSSREERREKERSISELRPEEALVAFDLESTERSFRMASMQCA